MRTTFRLIFIGLVLLIVLGAGAAFLGRQPLLEFINAQNNFDDLVLKPAPAAENSLDTTILNSPRFTSLKNNVVRFDFDDICKSLSVSGAVTVGGASSSVVAATSTPAATGCRLGNNAPIRNK